MSREEAIKLLVNATYSDEWQGNEDLQTALHMAIDALKQAPNIDKVMATIDFEEKWLLDAGYNCSNVNTAFRSIKHDLRKLGGKWQRKN